ncbi:MAG: barstar family protein [Lacipirellulaceae bacterium]
MNADERGRAGSTVVVIDGREIHDWGTLHDAFAKGFGFPDFYGRNGDALIDCLSDLDQQTGMTSLHVEPGSVVVVRIDQASDLKRHFPEGLEAIIDWTSLVNWRRIELGDPPVICLAFDP